MFNIPSSTENNKVMGGPPKLPPRNIDDGADKPDDKSLPSPPTVDAEALEAGTPSIEDDVEMQSAEDSLSIPLEERESYRPLPTIPKIELSENPKSKNTPAETEWADVLNDAFQTEIDELISFPGKPVVPEPTFKKSPPSVKSMNSKKSGDELASLQGETIVSAKPLPAGSIKSVESGSLKRKTSLKSMESVKSRSSKSPEKEVKSRAELIKENHSTEIVSIHRSPSQKSIQSIKLDNLERKPSKSNSIKEGNNAEIVPLKPDPPSQSKEVPLFVSTEQKSLPLPQPYKDISGNASNSSPSTNKSSIPATVNSSNLMKSLDTNLPNSTTSPVPIYAGGVFLGYGTGNSPLRPVLNPVNQQLYARPRPGAMYARPAAENIPLGLQYRPGDVRPRPAFRPGFRPHPGMVVRQGIEQGYRPEFRPIYRPRPVAGQNFRPQPSADISYRPVPLGMYQRPLPNRPYGGSEVNFHGGSDVGYQAGAAIERRASQMEFQRNGNQVGLARKPSLLDNNHLTGNSAQPTSMDVDVDRTNIQTSSGVQSSPLSSVSNKDQNYRNSVPVSYGDPNQRFGSEYGLYNVPRPFDPSRPIYRGPAMMQSFDNMYRQSFRPPPQRPASYHYPQGYYRPSQAASFHSSESNSPFRPARPPGFTSQLEMRSSPEPDQDSPTKPPDSPGKRRMSINSEAESQSLSPGKRQGIENPDSPTKQLIIGEMSLDPQPSYYASVPSQLPIPDAGGGYRNNSLNFTSPKHERRRSFERAQNEAHFTENKEGPVLSRRSSLDDGTLTRKGKKVQIEDNEDVDSDAASSAAISAVDSALYSDMRPTFVTISRPRRDAGSRWIDPFELLNKQRIECNASKDPKVHFEFAKSCLSNGEPYLDEGFAILRRLASSGYPEAHYFLGEAFADDGKDALAYAQYLSAAKRGYAPACFAIGKCAEEGKGCKKNTRLALEMYSKAATAGNLQAMHRLGKAEMEGSLGMKKDPVKAAKWFKRAAAVPNREHPEPLYELAVIYETGVPPYIMQDYAYARGVLQEAADFGYPPAIYKLGYCYEHGLMGYEVNPAESIRLYSEAMELGFTEALLGMAGWHMTGADTLLPQNQEMAFYLVKEAADRELARAQYTLGYFYEGGIGTYINLDLAFKYYELAAAQGEERAIERIKKANPNSKITMQKPKKRSFFGGLFSKK